MQVVQMDTRADADDRERLAGGTGRQYRGFDVSNQLNRDNL